MERMEENEPLLEEPEIRFHEEIKKERDEDRHEGTFFVRVKTESKKLWRISGPAVFNRLANYTILVVTLAFAGHMGTIQLAAITITVTILIGFNYGLLLGMASALETLCGQAFGARQYSMLGIYLQRSWIVLFLWAVILLPMYMFASPILKLAGLSDEIATMTGTIALWAIPQHFAMAFLQPLNKFLQCQLKNITLAWSSAASLVLHVFISWLFIYKLNFGVLAAALTMCFSFWFNTAILFLYAACGGCPLTWGGFSREAFQGLWEFIKLSLASGVMLCLENWYYGILILLVGFLKESEIAVDAISVCMNINSWQMMIPIAFLGATGVRVANELGAGNGKAAQFATIVATTTSLTIGIIFFALILCFRDNIALIFSSNNAVIKAVDKLSILLAFTVLLNSVQPILSGVAVGSGWQSVVAYINIGCYYFIGIPLGILMSTVFHFGVTGLWSGMIGGTLIQTLILAIITVRCNWKKEAEKASLRINKYGASKASQKGLEAPNMNRNTRAP